MPYKPACQLHILLTALLTFLTEIVKRIAFSM